MTRQNFTPKNPVRSKLIGDTMSFLSLFIFILLPPRRILIAALLFFFFLLQNKGIAQSVGISENPITPNALSILEISSTNKGILLPRVTTAQMTSITGTVAPGLTIYNTNENMLYYNNSNTATANWVPMLSNSPSTTGLYGGWGIIGNSGTNASVNSLGTSDATDLVIKTNNIERARVSAAGKLGLGNTSPAYWLTLTGSNAVFAVENNATFVAKNPAGTYEAFLTPRGSDNVTYLNYGSGGLNIRNTGYTSAMFINNSLNVGIYNTSPTEKLDVTGNIKASGTIYWGESNTRSERRDNAGLQGSAGAKSGFFYTDAPSPASTWPSGASSWWHLLDVRGFNTATNYAMQISGSYFDRGLYFRKTNNNAGTAWSKFLTSSNALPYNATRTTFAKGTTTEFYSDANIKIKWDANHGDVYFAAQTGSTGDWAVYSLFEQSEGGTDPDSYSIIRTSTSTTDWELLGITSDGSAVFGPGGVAWLCKKDDATAPIYKIMFHRHGSYKTAIVEKLNAP